MHLFVQFPTFSYDSRNWNIFLERLEQQFLQSEVADPAKKKAILLNYLNDKTYEMVLGLCSSKKPAELSYEALVKSLSDNFAVSTILYVERKKFYEVCYI